MILKVDKFKNQVFFILSDYKLHFGVNNIEEKFFIEFLVTNVVEMKSSLCNHPNFFKAVVLENDSQSSKSPGSRKHQRGWARPIAAPG